MSQIKDKWLKINWKFIKIKKKRLMPTQGNIYASVDKSNLHLTQTRCQDKQSLE